MGIEIYEFDYFWKKTFQKVIRLGVEIYEFGFCLEKLNINHIEKAIDWGSNFMNLDYFWKKSIPKSHLVGGRNL